MHVAPIVRPFAPAWRRQAPESSGHRAKYTGIAKTHLQHILTAAIAVVRVAEWLDGVPLAKTRWPAFVTRRQPSVAAA